MRRPHTYQYYYRLRILASMATSLALLIALVHLWPTAGSSVEPVVYVTGAEEPITLDEVQPTRQGQEAPPPPAPLPPVVVPDDIVLEDEPLDLTSTFFSTEPPLAGPAPGEEAGGEAQAPDVDAKQLRIVEPEYTAAARRAGLRARVVVEVLIDEEGHVREALVLERFRLGPPDNPSAEAVPELGYGLEESALEAARRTTFFPARSGGQPVPSRKTITIRFGV